MTSLDSNKPVIGYKVKDWIPIVGSAAFLLYWWQPWAYLNPTMSLILFINFSIVAGLLWWADGYEREPGRTIVWSILWGTFTAIFITSLVTPGTSALFVAAIVEEASKLLGLFWIYKRGSIHSATDALVMGGFIGLGFTIFEDFTYTVGDQQAVDILIFRGIFSVFAHTLFSGIGAAIMYLLWRKLGSGGVILGFICSYLIHYLWNISLSIDLASISIFLYFIIYAVWPPILLIITCTLVRRKEIEHIRSNGSGAVFHGIIASETLEQILNRRLRRQAAKAASNRRAYKKDLSSSARRVLEFNEAEMTPTEDVGTSSTESNPENPWT